MKKFLSLILFVFLINFIAILNVKAVSISTNSTTVNVGKSVKINITNVISGKEYQLKFDEAYFDVTSTTCGNRSKITSDCELTVSAKSSLSLTENKTLDLVVEESSQSDESKKVSITIIANKATTAPTTTTTTTPTNKSTDASLKDLKVKTSDGKDVSLTPTFSPTVYEYEATVSSTTKTVEVTPTLNDSKATVLISNNVNEELLAGETNKITVTVTAEDGTKRPYVINIKREALTSDATLKELQIEEDKSFELKEDVFNYTVNVKKSVTKLTILYSLSDENAAVDIEGNEDLKDGSKVRITVTAQDETKKVYTLAIKKENATTKAVTKEVKAEKNPLIIMALSIVGFGLIGGIIYVIKK